VLYKDADMDVAIPGAANGIFFSEGQCCNAESRLYIERDVYDEVVQGISDEARKIKVGPGLDPDSQMGPLTSAEQHDKVIGYLSSGLGAGARAPVGGGRAGDLGYFVQPTVLTDTTPDMKLVREEIFGPVVCAIPFHSEDDDVIQSGNDTNYGLASGIWTRDISKAHRTAHRLRAGTVWINCYGVFDAAMPFGGYKESGWGRGWATTPSITTSKPSPWSPTSHRESPCDGGASPGPAIAVTIKRRRHHEGRCRS